MPSLSALPPTTPVSNSGKQRVVVGLLKGLLQGVWKDGDRVTEASAVEAFKVSRTPVREAFLELQGLGLLELKRNCGAITRTLGAKELDDIYSVRALLEIEASRLAASKLHLNEQLSELADAFREIETSGSQDPDWHFDRQLHALIANSCGNGRLASEIARYGALIQSVREIVVTQSSNEIHLTSAREHLNIIDALSSGQAEAAAASMQEHLEQASESAISAMNEMRG